MVLAARDRINTEFKANKNVKDSGAVGEVSGHTVCGLFNSHWAKILMLLFFQLVTYANEVAKELKATVVQAEGNSDGIYSGYWVSFFIFYYIGTLFFKRKPT